MEFRDYLPTREQLKTIIIISFVAAVLFYALEVTATWSITVLQDENILYTSEEVEANKLNPPRTTKEILLDIEERLEELQLLHVQKQENLK